MRTIFLLRGAPGSGKSTWIKSNGLSPYAISADEIRLLYSSPIVTDHGDCAISQDHDNDVWDTLFTCLEQRMDRGEFIIVVATHYRAAMLQRYKKYIHKYRYRAYVIDFTDVPIEEVKRRNKAREAYKFVPESVIDKQYAVFQSNFKEVSNQFNILKPDAAIELLNSDMLFDFNNYKRIICFGDIHGCYEPVKKYFEDHPISDDTAYIFLGDYLDRGVQNKEVLEFLISIKDRRNVHLIEGNHERWLRMYADESSIEIPKEDETVLSKYVDAKFWRNLRQKQIRNRGFLKMTVPQIESVNKKDVRQLCRKFMQMAYFKFRDKKYFITHGGISIRPNLRIATEQYIQGTGTYEDLDSLYDAWLKHTNEDEILIHAHRNVFNVPAKQRNGRCYNLDSSIEYGNPLRILKITDKRIQVIEYENPIYDTELRPHRLHQDVVFKGTGNDLLDQLNSSNLIVKKLFKNGIISYNFSHKAFYDRKWNELTCTARGLFVKDNNVVARSYNKFFNWGERENTKSSALHDTMKFPVKAFRKENGFLAMVSSLDGKLLMCSKSSIEGEFVGYIKLALDKLGEKKKEAINQYCKKHNCTFVFECVDHIHDPHIVEYAWDHLYLLDIIDNDFTFKMMPYDKMVKVAKDIGLEYKTLEYEFANWEELYKFKKEWDSRFDPVSEFREGWVFVDANGLMVKYKTKDYSWWKSKRAILNSLNANHFVKPTYLDTHDIKIFELMNHLKDENKLAGMNIIEVRKLYRSAMSNGN